MGHYTDFKLSSVSSYKEYYSACFKHKKITRMMSSELSRLRLADYQLVRTNLRNKLWV